MPEDEAELRGLELRGLTEQDIQAMVERNQALIPPPLGIGPEGKARLRMFDETCPMGQFQMSDLEGVLIDCGE